MRRFRFHDHDLQLLPVKLIWRLALLFFLPSLLILQEQYSDEKVQEEETSDQDKDDEKDRLRRASQLFRPIVSLSHINGLVHYIGPALERSNNEKRHHCLANVVKV